jgi:hypothetical protein
MLELSRSDRGATTDGRIVIHGYLSGLSRPEQVVHFFCEVLGIPVVSKEVRKPAHRRLSVMGRGLRSQSRNPDSMGRRGSPERGSSPTPATPSREGQRLRRLLFLQQHGTGADLPDQRSSVSDTRRKLSPPGAAAETLPALLLLYPGPGSGAYYPARRQLVSFPGHLLAQRSHLPGTGAEPKADRLPQEQQRLLGG